MTMRPPAILAAAGFLALSTQAYAWDPTPDAARIVSDPLYLPLQSQLLGTTSYAYGTTTENVFDDTGARTSSNRIDLNEIDQALAYGVTDDLTLRLNWGYAPSRTVTRQLVPSGSDERSGSGWTDPDFGVTWRVLDQRDNPLTLDLRADYSPDAFPAKAANTDDDGTVARGGQMADLGATLGREMGDFTIAGTFDAKYLGSSKVLNQVSDEFTRTDALWNYTLGLDTQTRITDRFSINAGLGHTFANDADVVNETNGLEHIAQTGDSNDFNVALNYHFIPNTVVGSIRYQHNFYDATHNVFPAAPVDNTAVLDRNEDVVGVTLRYLIR